MTARRVRIIRHVSGFGVVLCPKCEVKGTLVCMFEDNCGPYWSVQHSKNLICISRSKNHVVFERRPGSRRYAHYLGKLSDEELDSVLKARSWPVSSVQAWELINAKLGVGGASEVEVWGETEKETKNNAGDISP